MRKALRGQGFLCVLLGAQASCSPRRHEDAKNRKGFLRVFVVRFFWLRLGCTVEFVASKTATN
ncbi:MAG: hypothetical protein DMG10_12875 [Acidobacteria bacterium]|nr:MAG: hypothetical protein DMG10_12875 [Acidobacteriota bacterium]